MSGTNQVDPRKGDASHGEDSRKAQAGGKAASKGKRTGRPADVGRALRSVYDDTLREDIPAEFRDLLGRLG